MKNTSLKKEPLMFHLISILWGKPYIDFFLQYVLPTYLAPENIPKAAKRWRLQSYIYMKAHEKELLENHPAITALKTLISLEICPLPDPVKKNKYDLKGYGQAVALKKAMQEQAIVLLLNPDSLVSNGAITKICERIAEGYSAVLCGELARVETEKLVKKLPANLSHSFTSRELVDLGLSCLHKIGEQFFWDADQFSKWNSIIYWKTGKKSLLAKFFHLHPLAIDMRNIRKCLPEVLMPDDGGLLNFLGIDLKKTYVVENSEELVCIEVSYKDMMDTGCTACSPKNRIWKVFSWALSYTLIEDQRFFCEKTLIFQGSEELDEQSTKKQWVHSNKILFYSLRTLLLYYETKQLFKRIIIYFGGRKLKYIILNLLKKKHTNRHILEKEQN